MRILFTGGSGRAGRHVVTHLVARGHRVLNLDLTPAKIPGAFDLTTDLTDAGQVFSALSGITWLDDLDAGQGVPKFDAVIHFAAISRILLRPDPECFRINTLSTYNVLEPHEYAELAPQWRSNPACRRRNMFAYIDTRDLIHFIDCALAADGLGYEVFNVANADSSVETPSDELVAKFYDDVPLKRELAEFETFYAIDKAREMLGFAPQSRWR